MLYGLMPKEALHEAMLTTYGADDVTIDDVKVKKIIEGINKAAVSKAFRQGVGAL